MPLPPGARGVSGQPNRVRLADGRIVTRSTALSIQARAEGYSSEYERRAERRAEDKRAFWRPRVIKLINRIDWEILYEDDGAPDRERLSNPLWDDQEIGFNAITPERVLELGEQVGYDRLAAALREKINLQDLYWNGAWDKATSRWLTEVYQRDSQRLPDWFFWYHGAAA
jgi:hypothetical protein